MPNAQPQNYENHSRFPTPFVVAMVIVIVAFFLIAGGLLLSDWELPFTLIAVGGIVLCLGVLHVHYIARVNALCLQDRLIRLEMEVRFARVLPADLQDRARELTIKQRVALRFASDAELAELTRKVLDERIQDAKSIKRLVKNWQADHQRV